MKKIICFVLAAAMLFSIAACTSEDTSSDTGNGVTDGTGGPVSPVRDGDATEEYPPFDLGSVTLVKSGGTVAIDHTSFAGDPDRDYRDEKYYTYYDYMSDNATLNFNPLSGGTADGAMVLGYTVSHLYDWRLNDSCDGWAIVPEMAAALPVDVTDEYAGQYGISGGDVNKAFRFTLREGLAFEDGTPINADTFIYSYRQLLDPLASWDRADSLIAGTLAVWGAKNYSHQGSEELISFSDDGPTLHKFLSEGGTVDEIYVDLSFLGIKTADGSSFAPAADETMILVPADNEWKEDEYVSAKYIYDNYLGPDGEYYRSGYDSAYLGSRVVSYDAGYKWSNVGIFKTGDLEFVIVFENSVPQPEYHIPYGLFDLLLKKGLYEDLKRYYDADGNEVAADAPGAVSVATSYGTSPETFVGYGPYTLTSLELDEKLVFERNENWWGYGDGEHYGMYQADRIVVRAIPDHGAALDAFTNGDIDYVDLRAEDLEQYGSSDGLVLIPQSYTTRLSFNTDSEKLRERGTEILDNLNFRRALALAIDRAAFAEKCTAAGKVEFGLWNELYISDIFSGDSYREHDAAKDAIVKLYGLTYGEGGEYETLDAALNAVTGYDIAEAQRLMTVAYYQCVEDGTYTPGQAVEFDLHVYKSGEPYEGIYEFLKTALEEAARGSGFEGYVTLKMTVDEDYYNTMSAGDADMILATRGGSAESPFTMLYRCYCDDAFGGGAQNEYGFETDKVTVTMTLDGHVFTASLRDWARWTEGSDPGACLTSDNGEETLDVFAAYDADTQCIVYAKLEYAYLANFATVSLYSQTSAAMLSQKVAYGTDRYDAKVGFGGIQYMTFNYDDAEWETVRGTR